MKKIKTKAWDAAEYLETDADIEEYLRVVFETGDTQLMIVAIGDVARAKGMTQISSKVNCGRESLYKSLSESGNPSFGTVVKVMSSIGFDIIPTVRKAEGSDKLSEAVLVHA